MWYLCIVLREITQNKTDRDIANFIGLFLFFFEKYQGKVPFFFSFVWQLYFNDFIFEIWIENILQKNIITLVLFQKIAKEHLNFQYSFRVFFSYLS